MDAEQDVQARWSNTQAYGLAIICLFLGVVNGYLIHGSWRPGPVLATARQPAPQRSPEATKMQITPAQLNHMAQKQAELLLAQLEKDPNNATLLAELGKTYLYSRQFQTSADYYERSVKIKPDARVLTSLGGAYHFAGADEKAIEAWNRALQVDPNFADALFNLGLVKWQAESDPKAAVAAWNKMLKSNPNHPKRAQVEAMIARAKKHMSMAATGKTEKPAM